MEHGGTSLMLHQTSLLENISVCISSPRGEWGVVKESTFHPLNSVKTCSLILSLLEKDYVEVNSDITRIINKLDIEPNNFPYIPLILSALKYPTSSSYWPNLAVSWLKQGAPLNREISELLLAMSKNKKYDQKLRHSLKKVHSFRSQS